MADERRIEEFQPTDRDRNDAGRENEEVIGRVEDEFDESDDFDDDDDDQEEGQLSEGSE